MVVGDPLPAKISAGLQSASAVIVVISPASARSRWLHYELQIATERMVKGLRVLPVLLADAEIPGELSALLYADFRENYERGVETVMRSLEQLGEALARASGPPPFYKHVADLLGSVFDSVGSILTLDGYRPPDFDFCAIEREDADDIEIVYDEVTSYYAGDVDPIDDRFWEEFIDAQQKAPTNYFLLVSQRPVAISQPEVDGEPRVRVQASRYLKAYVVDLSGGLDDEEERRLLLLVREHAVRPED
jgi:hypothetical protein